MRVPDQWGVEEWRRYATIIQRLPPLGGKAYKAILRAVEAKSKDLNSPWHPKNIRIHYARRRKKILPPARRKDRC